MMATTAVIVLLASAAILATLVPTNLKDRRNLLGANVEPVPDQKVDGLKALYEKRFSPTLAVAPLSNVAIVSWNGQGVVHQRLRFPPATEGEDFRRAKTLAEKYLAEDVSEIAAASDALETHLNNDSHRAQKVWLDLLFKQLIAGRIDEEFHRSNWPTPLIQETQGIGSKLNSHGIGKLQYLLAATQLPEVIAGDALAVTFDEGTALLVELRSKVWDLPTVLKPSVVHTAGGAAFFLSPLATSAPLVSMNTRGIALARFAPGSDDMVAYGSPRSGTDTLTQFRSLSLNANAPGLESGIGKALLQFTQTNSALLTKIQTPGILLAMSRDEAYRYEWLMPKSEGRVLEYAYSPLTVGQTLAASTRFKHPELTRWNHDHEGVSSSNSEVRDWKSLVDWVAACKDTSVRVVLVPKGYYILLKLGTKPAIGLRLDQAISLLGQWRES